MCPCGIWYHPSVVNVNLMHCDEGHEPREALRKYYSKANTVFNSFKQSCTLLGIIFFIQVYNFNYILEHFLKRNQRQWHTLWKAYSAATSNGYGQRYVLLVVAAPKGRKGNLCIFFILSVCRSVHQLNVLHHSSKSMSCAGVYQCIQTAVRPTFGKILDHKSSYLTSKTLYVEKKFKFFFLRFYFWGQISLFYFSDLFFPSSYLIAGFGL